MVVYIGIATIVYAIHYFKFGHDNVKANDNFIALLLANFFAILNTYMLYQTYNHENLLIPTPTTSMINIQVRLEIGYYIGDMLYELQYKNWATVIHHILASTSIAMGHIYGFNNFMVCALFMFTTTNPLLAFSKYHYSLGNLSLAKTSFVYFSIMFFVCRILGMSIILKWSIIDAYNRVDNIPYTIINCLLLTLYGLQLFWFKHILRIVKSTP
jgi:hypothetical protein